jgi:hypothetical protein
VSSESSITWKIIAGICAALVTASGFYLKSCTGAQNDVLAAAEKDWHRVRTATQAYYDRQDAFNSAVIGLFDHISADSRDPTILEKDKQSVMAVATNLQNSCEEVKKARYEFMNDWANLETVFLLKHNTFNSIGDQCKGWLPMAQELGEVDSEELCTNQQYRNDFIETKGQIEDFKKNLEKNRRAEEQVAAEYETQFRSMSNHGIMLNCWTCVKRSIKR